MEQMTLANLHTCEPKHTCLLLLATEFGVVVSLQKLAETVFCAHIQRFQAESGRGLSYPSLRWDFSNWVILWLSLLHFLWAGNLPFKEESSGYKYTYFGHLGT